MRDRQNREIVYPFAMRDNHHTARATLSSGTETALFGPHKGWCDIVELTAVNTSTATIQVDLRASTAGTIIRTWYLPTVSHTHVWFPVPLKQANQEDTWTVDMPDVSGTTIYVDALIVEN
jgi:hypothetical protein